MSTELIEYLDMGFPERLAKLRKERGLTQKALAEAIGVHLTQVQRYEWGSCQPTLEVIRKLAIALEVNSDTLVFDTDERGPHSELRLKLEALESMNDEDKRVVISLIDAYIKKHRVAAIIAE